MLKGTQMFATLSSAVLFSDEESNVKNIYLHKTPSSAKPDKSDKINSNKALNPIQFFDKNDPLDLNNLATNTLSISDTLYSNIKETKLSADNTISQHSSKLLSQNPKAIKVNTFKDSKDLLNVKTEAAKNINTTDFKFLEATSNNSKTSNNTQKAASKKKSLASEKRAHLDMINQSLIRFYDNLKKQEEIASAQKITTQEKSNIQNEELAIPRKVLKNSVKSISSDASDYIHALLKDEKLDSLFKSTKKKNEFVQIIKAEIDALQETNEFLESRLDALRYDLKSREVTIDDLKIKIAQMYVEVESSKLAKKNLENDKTLLINEIDYIRRDKQRYYDQLVQTSQSNDQLQRNFDTVQITLAEQGSSFEKLKIENQIYKTQINETRLKALKEKEDMIKHLEAIESDIIAREKALHKNEYEKLMLDKVQQITFEKEKYAKIIESLTHELEQKDKLLCSTDGQLQSVKNEINLYKNKLSSTQQELSNKTSEIDKLRFKLNEVISIPFQTKSVN